MIRPELHNITDGERRQEKTRRINSQYNLAILSAFFNAASYSYLGLSKLRGMNSAKYNMWNLFGMILVVEKLYVRPYRASIVIGQSQLASLGRTQGNSGGYSLSFPLANSFA